MFKFRDEIEYATIRHMGSNYERNISWKELAKMLMILEMGQNIN